MKRLFYQRTCYSHRKVLWQKKGGGSVRTPGPPLDLPLHIVLLRPPDRKSSAKACRDREATLVSLNRIRKPSFIPLRQPTVEEEKLVVGCGHIFVSGFYIQKQK